MKIVVLAPRVGAELDTIRRYATENFGAAQAERYELAFRKVFQLIQMHETAGRARDEIGSGYRSLKVGSHVIFYYVSDVIEIVGIPHGRRSLKVYFSKGRGKRSSHRGASD
ncbi:MAG: type II toxin-antitoxin system RelE/ParE family toxin [Parvularculaceae bacterium]